MDLLRYADLTLAASGRTHAHMTTMASADKMFAHLQVIPSGHDRPLPRGPLPHQPSVLTPLDKRTGSEAPADRLPSYQEQPYQTFFHVYKPVTKYKKSDPPEPDFRLVVIKSVLSRLSAHFFHF